MKTSGPGLLFVGSFKITDSISVLVIDLLIFPTSSWFSLQRLYLSKNLSSFLEVVHFIGISLPIVVSYDLSLPNCPYLKLKKKVFIWLHLVFNCGACGMRDLPGMGPESLALQGRVIITGPLGKSLLQCLVFLWCQL